MAIQLSKEDKHLLEGVCEMHVHVAPDLFRRSFNEIEFAKSTFKVGYRATLSKNHFVINADRAQLVSTEVRGTKFFGGIVLNHTVGGLNPKAVRAAIGFGAKEVWMPTFHSRNHIKIAGQTTYDIARFVPNSDLGPIKGICILQEDGKIKQEVYEILDLVASNDIILGTGHISKEEIFALLKAAKKSRIKKILITHPGFYITPWPISDQLKMAEMGASMEHDVFGCMDKVERSFTLRHLVESIKKIGADKCIMATDFGQIRNPHPIEGMRQYIHMMLDNGFSFSDVEKMTKDNPAKFLGID